MVVFLFWRPAYGYAVVQLNSRQTHLLRLWWTKQSTRHSWDSTLAWICLSLWPREEYLPDKLTGSLFYTTLECFSCSLGVQLSFSGGTAEPWSFKAAVCRAASSIACLIHGLLVEPESDSGTIWCCCLPSLGTDEGGLTLVCIAAGISNHIFEKKET